MNTNTKGRNTRGVARENNTVDCQQCTNNTRLNSICFGSVSASSSNQKMFYLLHISEHNMKSLCSRHQGAYAGIILKSSTVQLKILCLPGCNAREFVWVQSELSVMAARVGTRWQTQIPGQMSKFPFRQ